MFCEDGLLVEELFAGVRERLRRLERSSSGALVRARFFPEDEEGCLSFAFSVDESLFSIGVLIAGVGTDDEEEAPMVGGGGGGWDWLEFELLLALALLPLVLAVGLFGLSLGGTESCC